MTPKPTQTVQSAVPQQPTTPTDLSPAFDYRQEAEMAADVFAAFHNRLVSQTNKTINPDELVSVSRMFFDQYLAEVFDTEEECDCEHENQSVILE